VFLGGGGGDERPAPPTARARACQASLLYDERSSPLHLDHILHITPNLSKHRFFLSKKGRRPSPFSLSASQIDPQVRLFFFFSSS
jgi:hypothetical protein